MPWIGTVFLLLGRYYIAKAASIGLLLSFIGDLLWMVFGLKNKIKSISFTGGLMAILDLWGWIKWIQG